MAIADIVLPRVCVVCGCVLLPQERHICLTCLVELPETYFWSSSHNPMADSFNARIDSERYEPYAYAAALFYYRQDSAYSKITQALKYGRNIKAGRFFASLLGRRLAVSEQFKDVDMIMPVPLHWMRYWKRGYNQAEVIARELSVILHAGMEKKLLKRCRRTRSQTKLSGVDKRSNVQGAFAIRQGRLSRLGRTPRHILLVDDVFTSGSTMAACHAALRHCFGPEVRISVACLAFYGHVV